MFGRRKAAWGNLDDLASSTSAFEAVIEHAAAPFTPSPQSAISQKQSASPESQSPSILVGVKSFLAKSTAMFGVAEAASPVNQPPVLALVQPVSKLPAVVATIKELPAYRTVLTAGDGSIYPLSGELANYVCAIDTLANAAVILKTSVIPVQLSAVMSSTLALLRGRLESAGFNLLDTITVAPALLLSVVANQKNVLGNVADSSNESLRRWRDWVDFAIKKGSSDLHAHVLNNKGYVRCRIDGVLKPLADMHSGVYTRTQMLHVFEQSFRLTFSGNTATDYSPESLLSTVIEHVFEGRKYNLRWDQIPGPYGPKLVVRIISSDENDPRRITSFEGFGLEKTHIEVIQSACRRLSGLVAFVGPTGAGKSTLQRIAIEDMPALGEINIVTLETPVEAPIQGAHQAQIIETGDDALDIKVWQSYFAHTMRHDIDMLVVQELVNPLTMKYALKTAITGHLAFGTAHIHLISNIAERLTGDPAVGLSRGNLTTVGVLNALVYVNLVGKLCPHCRVPASSLDESNHHYPVRAAEFVQWLTAKYKLENPKFFFKRAAGCVHCDHSGLMGRACIAETYQPDATWLKFTRDGLDIEAEMHRRSFSDSDPLSSNMNGKTAFDHALLRALRGEIDPFTCEQFQTLS
jgi:general secretion pathway protein E